MRDLLRHGTEGRRAEDFFALKNPTASAGFEPANSGTKGQHTTPRPSKQLYTYIQGVTGGKDQTSGECSLC